MAESPRGEVPVIITSHAPDREQSYPSLGGGAEPALHMPREQGYFHPTTTALPVITTTAPLPAAFVVNNTGGVYFPPAPATTHCHHLDSQCGADADVPTSRDDNTQGATALTPPRSQRRRQRRLQEGGPKKRWTPHPELPAWSPFPPQQVSHSLNGEQDSSGGFTLLLNGGVDDGCCHYVSVAERTESDDVVGQQLRR
jgi:hypothetical protein